ncbi:DUF4158 domain-containing protein [Nocardia salmonicida]|uniref:DUF4158 domain-containing protein n=1 Tax=Nocardia salmonicida TaxID=53431 RepID=UPI001FE2344F|nr:DUF4158 domain-containing protein [Nocardia salmonicida]
MRSWRVCVPEIGREELCRFFTLSPTDLAFVDPERGRGPADRLGIAVAMCLLPWLEFVPDRVVTAPPVAVARLAEQLRVDGTEIRSYGRRAQTRTGHLRLVAQYLGCRPGRWKLRRSRCAPRSTGWRSHAAWARTAWIVGAARRAATVPGHDGAQIDPAGPRAPRSAAAVSDPAHGAGPVRYRCARRGRGLVRSGDLGEVRCCRTPDAAGTGRNAASPGKTAKPCSTTC